MEPASRSYLVINRQRKHSIDGAEVRTFIASLSANLGVEGLPFSVVFITDGRIRKYNREYRGLDEPTDVLSFPGEDGYLGDILISSETAYNQARKSQTLTFEVNVQRLILHGLLHLMGYDHASDNGEMKALERRLRRRFQC